MKWRLTLQGNTMILVRYKVIFVKPKYEHAFSEEEELISEEVDETAFTALKIAAFIQKLGQGKTAVPSEWLKKLYPPSEYVRNGQLIGIPDEDKKYLRV